MEISIMFESKTLKLQWFWNKILAVFEKIYFSFLKTKTKNPSQRTTKLYTWKVEKRKRWKITEVSVFADKKSSFFVWNFDKNSFRKMGKPKVPITGRSSAKKKSDKHTGKSLSEALIFASTNPQYDNILFIELLLQYVKIPSS